MIRYCRTCRKPFNADASWKTYCLDCYRRRKREQEQRENETWQDRRQETPDELLERLVRRFTTDVHLHARRLADAELEERYQQGYAAGLAAARSLTAGAPLETEFLRELVVLTHPDRHPRERFEQANAVTARLLTLLKDVRRAA